MRRFAITVVVLVCLSASGTVMAFAQGQLDAPRVRIADASRVSITLEIEAGASGAPAGFEVEWMRKSDYDRLGGWPASDYDPTVVWCLFDGTPTLNVSTGSYVLGPAGTVEVEVGDLFDETGMTANSYDELNPDNSFVFRAASVSDGYADESLYSGTVEGTTLASSSGCVFTQGYWKNHENAWPVSSLTLGTVPYTKSQLLAILHEPAHGNGMLTLGHQLIATKLNIANGASPSPIIATVNAADAQIGSRVMPPIGSGSLSTSSVSANEQALDQYNNGKSGVDHCEEPLPVANRTLGHLKAIYR